jgi:hypothetical protein
MGQDARAPETLGTAQLEQRVAALVGEYRGEIAQFGQAKKSLTLDTYSRVMVNERGEAWTKRGPNLYPGDKTELRATPRTEST